MLDERKGLLLVLATALVSGVSIFLNKYAVDMGDAFVFTTAKNALVAVFLIASVLLMGRMKKIISLSKKQLAWLAAIGLVGGSAPFLIYFYALKMTSAVNAGLVHKTLFLWAGLMAVVVLKERISWKYIAGAGLLLGGSWLLAGNAAAFSVWDAAILVAVFLWAIEQIISKKAMAEQNLDGTTVALGRMFFGVLAMAAFLAATGGAGGLLQVSAAQAPWVVLTSALLFAYVFTYYRGLQHLSVTKATAILMLGQPITIILATAFAGQQLNLQTASGITLLTIGTIAIVGVNNVLQTAKTLGVAALAQHRRA